MLRIADYAKRSGIEWYEVLRNVVSNEAPSPVVKPTQGEIAVWGVLDLCLREKRIHIHL